MNEIVLDIESDGFYFESNKIWTIHAFNRRSGEKFSVNPFKDSESGDKLSDFIFNNASIPPRIIFHNGLGFDIFVIRKLLNIDFTVGPDTFDGKPVQFVDTYYLSMFLNPDRERHSIEYFGSLLGFPKMDYRQALIDGGFLEKSAPEGKQFEFYNPLMEEYCDIDVSVGTKTYEYLLEEWKEIYGTNFSITDAFKCGQKAFFLMSCQEYAGWKFDVESALKLKDKISAMMEEIRADIEPQLPARSLKKTEEKEYTMPAKPYKANGELSANMLKFIEKHRGEIISEGKVKFYGKEYNIVSKGVLDVKMPMEMANQDQMKEYFLSMGWEPTFYNFQRGPDGKPMRDPITRQLIKTSPKIQEAGKICPNLEAMETGIVKDVVKWLSLRNRQSVLQGWLDNPRLQMDGRIGAGRTGIAATHRQKHKVVVNVPKASDKVLLGKEFRSLWGSEDGMLIAAGDASALEGRVQGHYTWRYDGGVTAKDLLDGDIHSKTAKSVYAEDLKDFDITSSDFNKDDPVFKPYRDRSKNVFYATLYGAGDAKIASTAGLPESKGKEVSEKFWAANPGTKKLKDALERYWENSGKKKYLPAIDGRILLTRKKSALLNTIFQSCGGIIMDYAGCFLDSWLGKIYWDDLGRPYYLYKGCVVRRVGYFHDEYEFECEEDVAEEVSKMIEKAIARAGEFLKLNVPLAGEGKTGKTWKETH